MKINKKAALALVFASIFSFSFAQSGKIEDYISAEKVEQLKKNGSISLIHPKGDNSITMVPKCQYDSQIKGTLITKDEKGVPFTAEFLYLIPKSELLKGSSRSAITNDDISIVFRSISKMEGMRYHFAEKKNGDVLYKKAYTIASKNSDEKIPDQISGSADGKVLYCYQQDHTYGDTKYILHYYQNENMLYANFLNTIPMSYMGVKAVMDEKLQLNVLSIDCGDSLLLYLSTDVDAKTVPLFNVRKQIEDSMVDRMDAIYRWFMVQFE